jgi:hypothetical protein
VVSFAEVIVINLCNEDKVPTPSLNEDSGRTKFRYSQLHEPLVRIAFTQVPRSNHKESCIVYTKLTLSLG